MGKQSDSRVWVKKAQANDATRPVQCANHVINGTLVATNGYRLHIEYDYSDADAVLDKGKYYDDGRFPDFNAIIPKSFVYSITVHANNLIIAVKRAMVFSRDNADSIKLFTNDYREGIQLNVMGKSAEHGDCITAIQCFSTHTHIDSVSINGDYLLDALNGFSHCENVTIRYNDSMSPIVIKSDEEPNRLAVVMPYTYDNKNKHIAILNPAPNAILPTPGKHLKTYKPSHPKPFQALAYHTKTSKGKPKPVYCGKWAKIGGTWSISYELTDSQYEQWSQATPRDNNLPLLWIDTDSPTRGIMRTYSTIADLPGFDKMIQAHYNRLYKASSKYSLISQSPIGKRKPTSEHVKRIIAKLSA